MADSLKQVVDKGLIDSAIKTYPRICKIVDDLIRQGVTLDQLKSVLKRAVSKQVKPQDHYLTLTALIAYAEDRIKNGIVIN